MSLRCTLAAALACASFGCGLAPVELGPRSSAPDRNPEERVEPVSDAAIKRLRMSPEGGKDKGLELLYPAPPSLVVPANLAPITFEWRAMGMGMMKGGPAEMPADEQLVYELIARGAYGELRLYTEASSASVSLENWQNLLRAHVGETLRITLRALRVQSDQILQAKALELEVRPALPAGVLYTWSTTAGALGRAAIDDTRETYPSPPAPGSARCVGCHAVSRDGKRVLAAVGGEARLLSWPVAEGSPLDAAISGEAPDSYVFGSFDPTAARIAVTRGARLSILNADDGQLLQEMSWSMAMQLRYPEWSPDGRWISFVTSEPKPSPEAANGGSLARVSVALDGSLGALQPLVSGPMMKDATALFPSYSPNGDWIVFEKRKGSMRDAKDSSLWIVPAAGGEPVELKAASASKPGANACAPSFIPGDAPGRAYVVFSSRRAVGSFMPAEGQRQLFATAVDLQLAAAGKDPSHPAFWLPFQQSTSSYLRAQWAPAVSACTPALEVCNEADDDCDGQIDEDCCTAERDVCDDAQDNDCDGIVDEGCNCAFQEQCSNASDDDCDLQIDEMPCVGPGPGGK
jgi:Putative metal-binding motif